jgi:hypothetical protein
MNVAETSHRHATRALATDTPEVFGPNRSAGCERMRILAAKFADRQIASAVRELLRRRMNVAAPDLDIAPLANATEPATDDTVLAGRFPEHDAAEVAKLVRDAGGEIVANVDERWTLPRSSFSAHPWTLRNDRARI